MIERGTAERMSLELTEMKTRLHPAETGMLAVRHPVEFFHRKTARVRPTAVRAGLSPGLAGTAGGEAVANNSPGVSQEFRIACRDGTVPGQSEGLGRGATFILELPSPPRTPVT